jgi:hypothetical protein
MAIPHEGATLALMRGSCPSLPRGAEPIVDPCLIVTTVVAAAVEWESRNER